MNKERLLRLAEALETEELAKEHGLGFSMMAAPISATAYVGEDTTSPEHKCQTVGCIAGWTLALFGEPTAGIYRAAGILGLTGPQRKLLFLTKSYLMAKNVTPGQAAKVVRHFAETGEIDWSPYLPYDVYKYELAEAQNTV